MAGIDNLKERILKDDQKRAEDIIREAEEKANAILNEANAKAETILKDARIKAERAGENRYERIIARAQLDARNNVLTAKQEMIDKVMELAEQKVRNMDKEEYSNLLEELILKSVETGEEEVVFSKDDKNRIDPGLIARINDKLKSQGKKGMLRVSSETRKIGPGLVLKNGGIEINCSIGSQIRALRDSLEGEIAAILFESR